MRAPRRAIFTMLLVLVLVSACMLTAWGARPIDIRVVQVPSNQNGQQTTPPIETAPAPDTTVPDVTVEPAPLPGETPTGTTPDITVVPVPEEAPPPVVVQTPGGRGAAGSSPGMDDAAAGTVTELPATGADLMPVLVLGFGLIATGNRLLKRREK